MNRTLQRFFTLAIVLPLSAPLWADRGAGATSRATARFSADAYLEHVKYLASDELGGRGTGSAGIELAAEYIAEQLKAAGCQPAGEDGTWFQPFEVRMGKKLVGQDALLEIDGIDRKWKVRQDWIPFPFTVMEDVEAPLAFAGYGIQAARYDYDDYDEFDADGKALLILRYEPQDEDPAARFGGQTPSRHAFFVRKARIAARCGAKALLIVNPPNRDPDRDELFEFDPFASQQTHHLPMVHVSRELADAILRKAGLSNLKTLQEKLDKQRKALSQDLGLTVRLRPGVKPHVVPARNVIGLVPGDGSTQETIVVGAHYDHLGTVPARSAGDDQEPTIYNGADDNASGTAGVIELARAVSSGPPLRRNVLFITFGGEEMGLVGSRHFVKNPPADLQNIRAMLNLDMIGRLRQGKFAVFGVSTAREFPAVVGQVAEEVAIEYKGRGAGRGGSDHTWFINNDIPVMFLFTGVHKEYHQPEDDWELIDAAGAAKVLQLACGLVAELANMKDGPTFTAPTAEPEKEEGVPKPAIEEQQEAAANTEAAAEDVEESDEPPRRSKLRVRFGIIPDMVGDDELGMVIDGVLDGGPAKAAGLKDGDRIVKIADEDIRDIYAYMRVLRRFRPGDEVDVVVIRGGEKKTLKVKLEASKRRTGDK